MTFYREDHTIAQNYQTQQELEQLLSQLKPEETKVRILEYARKHRKSVGVFLAYHPEKDFPFEVSIDGHADYFAPGQFTIISGSEDI
ncbi:MAG TPA: hypothetical protein VEL31_21275 [Ktedonobacteraceae bacterium]|nr:hypothetical protein [Ktedonobacteraceae bacterium]